MTPWSHPRTIVGLVALVIVGAGSVFAQHTVTAADIGRLEASMSHLEVDIGKVRDSHPVLAGELETELQDVRDEVVYLRVRVRREGTVARAEYSEVRDWIDDLGYRARSASVDRRIPVGAEFDVRLQTSLDSASAQVED